MKHCTPFVSRERTSPPRFCLHTHATATPDSVRTSIIKLRCGLTEVNRYWRQNVLPVGANGYSCASHPFPRGCQSGAVSTLFARGTPSVLCKPQPARSDGGHPYPRSVSSSQLKLLHEKPFILRTPERDWCVVTLQLPAPWHKCQYWHRIT
jgi:hypothetical protein